MFSRVAADQTGGHAGTPPRHVPALHGAADRVIGAASLVSTAPLLDIRQFGWTTPLRERWREIRDEALVAPSGTPITDQRQPLTAAVLATVPALHSAWFEPLSAGAHVPVRHAASRALLTCHLGLIVPREGDLRMRLGERMVRWAEGETMVFDATQASRWWNDGSENGLVLAVQVRRPLARAGRWIASALLDRLCHATGPVVARTTSR